MRENEKDVFGREYEPDVAEEPASCNCDSEQRSGPATYGETNEEFMERYGKERNVPVKPSDKGLYKNYGCYRNECRKIPSGRRGDYAFPFCDGTYGIVKPGDVSPLDGKAVTEEDIAYLHRSRDNEVGSNMKFRHKDVNDYDLLERLDTEEEKKRRGLPNDYEEVAAEFKRFRLVIDQGSLINDGEGITEQVLCSSRIPTPEAALGLDDDPLKDAFGEVILTLTESERKVFQFVFIQGFTRTAAGKMLGVSEGTVRNRIRSIKEKLEGNPVIMRHVDIFQAQGERIQAWEELQKEKKKAYEQHHKEYLERKKREQELCGRDEEDYEDPDDIYETDENPGDK